MYYNEIEYKIMVFNDAKKNNCSSELLSHFNKQK